MGVQHLLAISGWQWVLAGAVPIGIVALYFLKLKRQPLQVPSTFLWKKSIEDLHVNSLWQKLRRSLLLLLQLLVAAAIIHALMRPTIHATRLGAHLILVIDQSASMSAIDVAPSRLETAKHKALEVVDQMHAGDVAMVIATSDTARVVCSYTEDAHTIRRWIRSIQPTARRTDPREALVIASGLANPQRAGEEDAEAVAADLYLFSDGRFPSVADLALGNLSLKYVRVGESGRNVGLAAVAARRSEADPDRHDVLVRVRNYSAEDRDCTTELYLDDGPVPARSQRDTIPAGQEVPMNLSVAVRQSATLRVRLEVEDDFPLDNEAWAVIDPPRPVRLLVVGPENRLLRAVLDTAALRAAAEVTYGDPSLADQDLAVDPQIGRFDLVVFDRCRPRSMPACNTFFLGAVPPTLAGTVQPDPRSPVILNWNTSHPLLRFLRLDDVAIFQSLSVPLPAGGRALIETDRGPALFEMHRGVYTDLVQAFPLLAETGQWGTDWPLRVSFPLFVMNVVRTLGGVEPESQQAIQAGQPVTLRAGEGSVLAIVRPSGKRDEVHRSRQGTFELLDTDELGVYRWTAGDRQRQLAVNLLDEAESAILPAQAVQVGAVTESDVSAQIAGRRELWKWLALAAFVILLVEWYIYNRRVYI